jgi:2-succinyl-5-enolpyruvyl-6-hydroxy-3-cyclohexene-1-carboxylate synthase
VPEPHAGDVAATFCATLVDEWVRHGVTRAVVAPGSRSTPMALALLADPRVAVSVHHDERSAGFVALGVGIATGLPAVVLTTSGTATAELHAAVVEAHHAGVPMLVCTADRPPELHGVGAPQTIDQTNLYGSAVRAFYDPGVPDGRDSADWRHLARSALDAALGSPPGPVQVNLAFTEPLVGTPGPLPDVDGSTTAGAGGCEPDTAEVALVADATRFARGVIVAGGGIARPAQRMPRRASVCGGPRRRPAS